MNYPFIQAWGEILGSTQHFIDLQIALANDEDAPFDAIYRKGDSNWATSRTVANTDTRDALFNAVDRILKEQDNA